MAIRKVSNEKFIYLKFFLIGCKQKRFITKIFLSEYKFVLIEWKYILILYKYILLNRNLFWLNKIIFIT